MKTFNLDRFSVANVKGAMKAVEVSDSDAMFKYGSLFEQAVDMNDVVVLVPQQMFKRTIVIKGKSIAADSLVALIYDERWNLKDCILFGVSQLTKKSLGTFVNRSKEYGTQALKAVHKLSSRGYVVPAEPSDHRMISKGSLNLITKSAGKDKNHIYVTEVQAFRKTGVEGHCFPIFNPDYVQGSKELWMMENSLIMLERKNCAVYEKVDYRGKLPEGISCLPCPEDLLGKKQADLAI